MTVRQAAAERLSLAEQPVRSPWVDAYEQLLRNQAAVTGGVFVVLIILVAIFAGAIAPYHYAKVNFGSTYAKPGPEFPAGADQLGRDILSRTIYGTRVSLTVGVVGATVSLIIGLVYGLISGYSGGGIDNLMMRIVDFMYGLPNVILVILMQVYFKAVSRRQAGGLAGFLVGLDNAMGGMFFIFVALGVFNWIGMARIARGQVLSVKEKEFVEAARAVGAGSVRIIRRHILPNILGPCIVAETLAIPGYIFFEAFLSFIGLGVNPPTPSWGAMINEGYQGLRSNPHLILAPSIVLTLTVLAFNFFGDGLRDAFDPSLRGVVGARTSAGVTKGRALSLNRLAVALVVLVVVGGVTIGGFSVLSRGSHIGGTRATPTPSGAGPSVETGTYVTEYGREVASPEVRYDEGKAAKIVATAPVSNIYAYPGDAKSMLGIITRGISVQVLGETTTDDGELYYLVRGFGTEGWSAAVDVGFDES
jgi:ABC-type dipeptide/oligopeptide/nickel transport system permease subunit